MTAVFGAVASVSAQGTAFTYQGQLNDAGSPAGGNYDLRFAIYNVAANGNPVALPLTNSAVAVTNGLFTTTLNFGPGIFTGSNYWLEIAARTNGNGAFTTLTPRQPLTPVPYAIFANGASNLLGVLPPALLSGTYPGPVTFNNNANNFTGTFSGNGSNLTSLNASQLISGTVADARLTANVALLDADQAFSGVNTFTNTDNSFRGSFFGNGLVGWIATNGTIVQAVRDTGYMLTSRFFTTVTLPPAGGLTAGDIVRISGAGGGGWQVKENSSQMIFGNLASYKSSYPFAPPSGGDYRDVAASVDGTRVYVVGNFQGVYASQNSGMNYSPLPGNVIFWQSVACSANGKIIFVASSAVPIQQSTNGGATWFSTGISGNTVACTASGSLINIANIACTGNGTNLAKVSGGVITISTNGGSTFNVTVTAPAANVTCVGASSDCTRLLAGVTNGLLYASANLGATWTPITTTNQAWSGAWMSADGSKFAGTVSTVGGIPGGIYYYGVNPEAGTSSTTSTGSIVGSQGSAVELQYIGNNQFMPVSSTGIIWAN